MIKYFLLLLIFFTYACSNTSPTNVSTSDAQKVTAIDYGVIKSSSPVKIIKDNKKDIYFSSEKLDYLGNLDN